MSNRTHIASPFRPAKAHIRAQVLAMIDSYLANGGTIYRAAPGESGLADDWQEFAPSSDTDMPDDIAAYLAS